MHASKTFPHLFRPRPTRHMLVQKIFHHTPGILPQQLPDLLLHLLVFLGDRKEGQILGMWRSFSSMTFVQDVI